MIPVKLTVREMREVRRRARARHQANLDDGRQTLKMAINKTDEHINLVGVFCEFVVEKVTGQVNNCIVHRGSGFREATNRPDVGDWEVKGTERPQSQLLIPVHLKYKHDLQRKYLLVYADLAARTGTIKGWAFGWEFIGVDAYINWNLPCPAYWAPILREFEV